MTLGKSTEKMKLSWAHNENNQKKTAGVEDILRVLTVTEANGGGSAINYGAHSMDVSSFLMKHKIPL